MKKLLVPILSIILCLSLMAGASFALFTSSSEVNVAITSGKVDIKATVANVMLKDVNETDYTRAVAVGETVGFESGSTMDTRTVSFNADQSLTFANMVCGDSVKFDVNVVNESTVNTKYRVHIYAEGELFSGLQVTADGKTFLGNTYTEWKLLVPQTNGETVSFEVTLPDTGNSEHDNKFQGKTCRMIVTVEGVQGNGETFNDTNAGVVVETATTSDNKLVTAEANTISSNGFEAVVPAGTELEAGSTTATLTVNKAQPNAGAFDFVAVGGEAVGLDISIPEVADGNATPIAVTVGGILEANLAGVLLYHKGNLMTEVANKADVDADGEYYYDAATGDVTFATVSFSNFTVVKLNAVGVATEAELIAAVNKGHNVQLTANVTLTKTLAIKKDVLINLNGYTLDSTMTGSVLMQQYSDYKPAVVLTSYKAGAVINAGNNSLALAYGDLTLSNVTVNVGEIKSSSATTFKMSGAKAELVLGEGTVVNVEYLGTSLIDASAALTVDGAVINVGTFKVNGGAMISNNMATQIALTNAEFNVGLDTTYTSYLTYRSADNTTITDCKFNFIDALGVKYAVKRVANEAVADRYGIVLDMTDVATEAELVAAVNKGQNVRLTANVTLTKTLLMKKDIVIDLNGYALEANLPSHVDNLLQSSSDTDPSVIILSKKEGAKINAGAKSVILGYGSTAIYNVEINVGDVRSSSYNTFKVYGDLTLGAGTVVNVEFLGTSLISNNGAVSIVIDGAVINAKTFRVNGGSMISLNQATTVKMNNVEFNIGLDTTYSSKLISVANNVTANGCVYNVADLDGANYTVTETYGFAKA